MKTPIHVVRKTIVSVLLASMGILHGQTIPAPPVLIKDINKVAAARISDPDDPKRQATLGSVVIFAGSGEEGEELWRTDGTPQGTYLLRDFYPGSDSSGQVWSSQPNCLTTVGSRVYCIVRTSSFVSSLAVTDGTATGTYVVPSLPNTQPPTFKLIQNIMVAFQGKAYFFAYTSPSNFYQDLWCSDGTAAGTQLVFSDPSVAGGFMMVAGPSKLYMALVGPNAGNSLWVCTGTSASTTLLKSDGVIADPYNMATINDTCIFKAYDAATGGELWISDGSVSTTRLALDFWPGPSSGLESFSVLGNKIVCSANNGVTGYEPHVATLATTTSIAILADLEPGPSSSSPKGWTSNGNLAFFSTTLGIHDRDLYRTDGSVAGTYSLGTFALPVYNIQAMSSGPYQVYFAGSSSTLGVEPWCSDGTTAGTRLVSDLKSGGSSIPGRYVQMGSKACFVATSDYGARLCATDGTAGGTIVLTACTDLPEIGIRQAPVVFGNTVYIGYEDNDLVSAPLTGLYRSDGTPSGTVMVHPFASPPRNLIGLPGYLVFAALDIAKPRNPLWAYDLNAVTAIGTFNLIGEPVTSLTRVGSKVLFNANYTPVGRELWSTNGTSAGTGLVKDIHPTGSSDPRAFADFGGLGVFVANTPAEGSEVWRSDGSSAGTVLLKDINPGAGGANPSSMVRVGMMGFFTADNGSAGRELWVTDGSASGTHMVRDIAPGPGSSDPGSLGSFGSICLFTASDGASGRQLWRSDGTSAGTWLVASIRPGGDAEISSAVDCGSFALLAAHDGVHGVELWRTDGTASGTTLVRDVNPGAYSSSPKALFAVRGACVFSADNGTQGHELWTSDGTVAGTQMILDINPGPSPSAPDHFVEFNGSVIFSAYQNLTGRELWSVPVSTIVPAAVIPYGVGCMGSQGIPQAGAVGLPRLGNAGFSVTLASARINSPGAFLLGFESNAPLGFGCTLYVAAPIPVTLGFTTSATGSFQLPLPIANNPYFTGFRIATQYAIVDPVSPLLGIALSGCAIVRPGG